MNERNSHSSHVLVGFVLRHKQLHHLRHTHRVLAQRADVLLLRIDSRTHLRAGHDATSLLQVHFAHHLGSHFSLYAAANLARVRLRGQLLFLRQLLQDLFLSHARRKGHGPQLRARRLHVVQKEGKVFHRKGDLPHRRCATNSRIASGN